MPKSKVSHCKACKKPDDERMVSCCHCKSWWHYGCVGVNDSIASEDRPFTCPDCQQPGRKTSSKAASKASSKASSKATSKVSSIASSTPSTRAAKRAQLQLEQLEAQKQLALQRIQLERQKADNDKKQREAELEMERIELEQTAMNESYRLREIIELDGEDEEDDQQSVQSTDSKVRQWEARNSTMRSSTVTATGQSNGTATANGEHAGQDGNTQPPGITYESLQRALAGISLEQSALEPHEVGAIEQSVSTTVVRAESGIPSTASVPSGPNVDYRSLLLSLSTNVLRFPHGANATVPYGATNLLPGLANNVAQSFSVPGVPPLSNADRLLTGNVSNVVQVPQLLGSGEVSGTSAPTPPGPNPGTGHPPAPAPPGPNPGSGHPPAPAPPGPNPSPWNPPAPAPPGPNPSPWNLPAPAPPGPNPSPWNPPVPAPPGPNPSPWNPPAPVPPGPNPNPWNPPAPAPPGRNPALGLPPAPAPPVANRNPVIPPAIGPTYQHPPGWNPVPGQLYGGPTPRQLAARHVVCKELPPFDGNIDDWPHFISAYWNSTLACGYSDYENLSRLSRSLKGLAFTTVKSLLMLPEGVPHAIKMLETIFGRTELLIRKLIKDIKDAPAVKNKDDNSALVEFGIKVQNLSHFMSIGGHEAHMNDPELLMCLVQKLPSMIQINWGMFLQQGHRADIRVFAQYLEMIVKAALPALEYHPGQQSQQRTKEKSAKDKNFCGAHSTEDSPKTPVKEKPNIVPTRPRVPTCLVCESPKHRVKDCSEFATQKLDDRWKTVKRFGLCRTCLGAHAKRPCLIRKRCETDGCLEKHHPLLHDPQIKSAAKQPIKSPDKPILKEVKQEGAAKAGSSNAVTNHHSAGQFTLFRILPVTLYGNQRSVNAFAFLDDGSSRTLIDEEIVQQLGVVGEKQPLCLQWTANMKRTESDSQRVALEIAGRTSGSKHRLTDVRTVSRLDLPKQSLKYAEMAKAFPYLKGLPITDYDQAFPQILIGNDNAHVTATLKLRDGKPEEPIAAKTRLGWTVYGSNQPKPVDLSHSFHICECLDEDEKLHDLVEKSFAVESLGIMEVSCPESEEAERAKRILQETTKRVGQRFETGLLWKYDRFELPDSRPMAVKRLQCLERRIQKDPVIGESVRRQLDEHQAKGYIHKATEEELEEADPRRIWYLPLGVALNPKKPGKVRIFCDAAALVDGISLNSMLLKGPDLLKKLLEVLFGFRVGRIALCADLQEMFHQVLIRKEDRHAQRLLWRDDPTKEPDVYLMDVATFGATCSPCSAQFVKNKNAEEHAAEYPAAADAIIRKHYVDDYLDSADSIEEAVKIATEVRHVHSLGGFNLRNWLSNSKDVLARVGESDPATEKSLLLDKSGSTERVLGMFWRTELDVFTYSSKIATEVDHPTKRDALRVVMSPFDPAGLLSFFLVHGKILIQNLWRAKTDWDQRIPEYLLERWTQWTGMFHLLDEISIPRCYFPEHSVKEIQSLQLHVFVDASEEAYACVGYFRAVFPNEVVVTLVAGKSKVAPLKTLSIPRLELMAAVIGVRLTKTILSGHTLNIEQVVFWSDSKTVLAWINSDHRRYRQFVACKLGELLTKSRPKQWRYVPSKENVADDATKWGKTGPCLSSDSRWFKGPDFLRFPEEQWPSSTKLSDETTDEELRSCMVHCEAHKSFVEWDNFSQWTRLTRAIAFMHRFVERVRQRGNKRTEADLRTVRSTIAKKDWKSLRIDPLKQEELEKAETTIIRWAQREKFPNEVATFGKAGVTQPRRQVKLDRTSPIRKASPYMDERGVLRSDGRIAAATCLTFATKFPIIMPKDHRVTYLVCDWYHRQQLHGNRETVTNEMRQRFHVSELRALVRKVASRCQWCKVRKPKLNIPREAPLPDDRLQTHIRPFTFVGVDYFGPITVRVNRSSVKRWIALFTCMTIRAIHLEVVSSLSTESCKMAFRRFIAARGAPALIRSDRGTNFIGASNELKKEIAGINEDLATTFTNTTTKWMFNPPGAPHMGGVWERLVRSVKTALAAMQTTRNPTDEVLATMVKEAESLVNSRPLTYIALESGQSEALTPNHFLMLSSSGVVQTPRKLSDLKEACRSDWNTCQAMIDQFWRRWVREYLPTIARRTKWFDEVRAIIVGDLVVVVEEKIRNGWIRGRVVKLNQGRDGRVRSAVIQVGPKEFMERPVAKLALLDVGDGKADPDA